ncbi:dihydrofolate reductase family protein [Leifsonia shinshuensis]|uniref:Dihydrofolate reductase n=1 Tax=Leifsonia shinshuensis TaxID=150026 RepID=A0A853CXA5_9MICO|nr:dihydrofolate reductase family protein [Leifsonia shinshuensis]NYJ23804.1 dihydrofolate reductase [Leifsonia shinshuensis]
MALTKYYVASSIDGFIADVHDRIEWLMQFGFEEFDEHYQQFISGIGALVMGATTYEFVLGEQGPWPYQDLPTWVVTHRTLPVPEGADVTFFSGDIVQLDAELREAADDRDVWMVGGGALAAQFADRGLIDELHITYVPVLVGSGKPLLPVAEASRPLVLSGTKTFPSGAVEHIYRFA